MTQHTYEGTTQELSRVLAERPNKKFRLIEIDEDDMSIDDSVLLPDPGNAASIALLESWIAKAPTDPDEIRLAEEELSEFKRNMNSNRAATGERLPYPETSE